MEHVTIVTSLHTLQIIANPTYESKDTYIRLLNQKTKRQSFLTITCKVHNHITNQIHCLDL
jgi:hypothetical protein